jgi:hypothetical protein
LKELFGAAKVGGIPDISIFILEKTHGRLSLTF